MQKGVTQVDSFFMSVLNTNSITNNAKPYVGRFAPSPSGPLHFGSLVAAVASYLCARKNNGKWLLRIEDVDSTRVKEGATQSIIETLDAYDFEWDGEVVYQSRRSDVYQEVLESLSEFTFPCSCTRKELQSLASTGTFSYLYPKLCRDRITNPEKTSLSVRLRSDQQPQCADTNFIELCQTEPFLHNIEQEVSDFILKRSDGFFAYQLAVVVDDELQGVTDVVRGADLFDNTPRQIYLQNLLAYQHPTYLHFPVAVDNVGKKLSKQNLSPAISNEKKMITLIDALDFLGQKPPQQNQFTSMDDLWHWAVQNWQYSLIPKVLSTHYE